MPGESPVPIGAAGHSPATGTCEVANSLISGIVGSDTAVRQCGPRHRFGTSASFWLSVPRTEGEQSRHANQTFAGIQRTLHLGQSWQARSPMRSYDYSMRGSRWTQRSY